MLCQPVAIVISSPLSGLLLDNYNWRVMFIVQGLLPILFAAVWWRAIEDRPSEAAWLSESERRDIESRLPISKLTARTTENRWSFLQDRNVQLFIVLDITFACGAYGLLMWLPTALRSLHTSSNLALGLVAGLPYVFACFGSVYNSRHSDRARERRWHVAVPCVIAGVSLMLSATAGAQFPVLAVALLCITGAGVYAAIGPMWAMLTEIIPPASTGIGIGLINGLANLGGFAGPFVVGALRDWTTNFYSGFLFLSGCLIVAGLCSIMMRTLEPR